MKTCLLFSVLVASLYVASSTRSCDDYKRQLKSGSAVNTESRKFMNCWGKELENGQSDLVILMDKSGSMDQSGWDSAKDFVEALLTEVKVAFNATRIAIGTFATKHEKELNYLWNPSFANHKCRFVRDFQKVTYQSRNMGYMTNMKGSLVDAHEIFLEMINKPTTHYYRPRANKVVMVLSDGIANTRVDGTTDWSSSVTPEVLQIRQIGMVEMYAVAVTKGSDQATMRDKVATDKSLYIYQPTFNGLISLAKSIRGDPYEKDYETRLVLQSECKEGCDADADCGCNLRSGKYKCACRRGYFGTGEKKVSGSSCQRCPVDTYGNKAGFTTTCTACPANAGTKGLTGKLQIADCYCKTGYTGLPGRGLACTTVKCNPVNRINNGYVYNQNECGKNEFGATCIFRCNPNFKLVGNDVLTCGASGTYIGDLPECLPLRCSATMTVDTTNYTVDCKGSRDLASNTYGVGETCTFSCGGEYYHHSGSIARTCLHSEQWSGTLIDCRAIACPKVPKEHEKLTTERGSINCFDNTIKVGETCTFQCPGGYQITGSKSLLCKKDVGAIGKWFSASPAGFVSPNCSDIERPKFSKNEECYNGIELTNNTVKDKNYGLVNFEAIGITDNSGGPITVVSSPPGYELGRSYQIGITKMNQPLAITFHATDASGNSEQCRFRIQIKDTQKPTLLFCPPDQNIKSSDNSVVVTWDEPRYSDNCGNYSECKIDIYTATASGSRFTKDTPTRVSYTATDPSGNVNEECIFNVHVKAPTCPQILPPKNGMMLVHGTIAFPSCPRGVYPSENFPTFYTCKGGKWVGLPMSPVKKLVPDCIEKTPPTGLIEYLYMFYVYDGDCNSAAAQEQAKTNFVTNLGLCGDNCEKGNIEVNCGAASVVARRKRSSVKQLSVRVTIKITRSKEEALQDKQGAQLKSKMQTTVAPKVIQKANTATNLDKIDPNIRGIEKTANFDNNPKLSCADKGIVYSASASDDTKCAPCPSGEFKNMTTGICETCPAGTYQPNEGATACVSCPEGSTSLDKDVSNFTSCRRFCGPGEYSENGLAPCTKASPGYYTEGSGSRAAIRCPTGTTTVTPGTKSRNDCGTKCQPGTYSETGVEPCKACEEGTYQTDEGKVSCIECPGVTWTHGEGSDDASRCVDINACARSPCLSGGHCVDLKVGFRCECKRGYWGKRCEKEVDECALKPCLNGGKCLDKFLGYMCICPDGARGKNCEELYGICKTGVCGSNGNCMDLADNSYKCVCKEGYTGPFCETKLDACEPHPCKNDGVCESKSSSYTCKCKPGFTGDQCETKLNFCASEPCKNGGECSDSKYGFICKCTAPYFGVQCEQKTNMCRHTICQHSVACKDLGTDVKCSCKPGYGGKYCDRKLASDFDIGFQNREAPTFSSIEGKYDISQLTVAFWLRTSDKRNKGTPLSYANKHHGKVDDNALVIADYTSFDLTINNVTANLEFSANDGEWHHVAITWSSSNGQWIAYKDGTELKRSSAAFQQGQVVSKGGIFIIGEEQDEIGGSFTPTESFFGDMSQLNVWKSVLSPNHIYDLATSCKHASGDVLAWADFSEESHGNIIKTEPSLACDFLNPAWGTGDGTGGTEEYIGSFNNKEECVEKCLKKSRNGIQANGVTVDAATEKKCYCEYGQTGRNTATTWINILTSDHVHNQLREFQLLRGWQLPSGLRSVIATETHNDAKSCAVRCSSSSMAYRCRSFIHDSNARRCTFYSKSLLIETSEDPVKANQYDLYQYSCVKPLGLSESEIPNSKMSASSSMPGSAPYMARLYNTPKSSTQTYAHWSPNDNNPYIQIDLGSVHKITGIATQGHYLTDVREFATYYTIQYKKSGGWTTYSSPSGSRLNANRDSQSVVRNEVFFYATVIRISPRKDSTSNRIALRMEIYGCPNRPQGQPIAKSDGNHCAASPCRNGGTCVDLYQRYICVCAYGFIGAQCEKAAPCPDPDIPVYGRRVSSHTTLDTGVTSSVVVGCLTGYTTTDNTAKSCVRGRWVGSKVTCRSKNECTSKPCFGNNCQELEGGYRCYCPAGYNLAADKKTCQDINECAVNDGGCNQGCVNTPGSFQCVCNSGYVLDGKLSCVDKDECQGGSHGCAQDCVNTLGSYKCLCKTGYTLNANKRTCDQISCPYIPNVANGQVSRSRLQVTFTCSSGYELNGPAVRKCYPDGKWSGEQPTCTRVSCGKPGVGTTKVASSSTNVGSVARYSCQSSYRLLGASTRTCLQSGQWSGNQPRCTRSACPRLSSPINGQILGLGTVVGSVARVKCNTGYRLVQTNLELRTCQSNGQWTGGNTAVVTCKIIDCGTPKKNSYVQISLRRGTTYQSAATYSCSQSSGQRCVEGSATRHCNADGKWSGKEPTCVANSCCKPSIPDHSTFYSDNRYNFGDKVYTKCDTGYVTGGTALRTCQNNGQYTGAPTTCTIVDCGDPGSVSNGVRMMGATTYQKSVKYFCNPAYKLVGSVDRVCQADGKWSGQATSCVVSSCGGKKLGNSGTITTAGGKEVCHWLIQVGQGKKVNIDFTSFNIGDKDMVKIYDGQKYEEYITFTKKQKPRSFTGNSHFMRVIYIGGDTSGTGFTLNFKGATCGGHLDNEFGVITSPGYPIKYNPNDECFWTVHRPYQKLQLAFPAFFLQKNPSDYLEIFEGPFQKSRMLLYKTYGYSKPLADWADRWMWLHFKVDYLYEDKGFKAVYGIYEPRVAQ